MMDALPMSPGPNGLASLRPTRTPVFGIAGRRALWQYLKVTLLVMSMFLIVAWAIDLAQNLDGVLARAEVLDRSGVGVLAIYLIYRMADIVTRLFPVAVFIAIFASELYRLFSRETTILGAAGWSPRQTLLVVLVFSLGIGAFQFSLERWLRPAAVFAQADLQLGGYGRRFYEGQVDRKRWFVVNGNVIRASIIRSDTPRLEDIEIYRGVVAGDLRDVLVASRGEPADQPGFWRFYDVDLWASLPGERSAAEDQQSPARARQSLYLISRYETLEIRLDLVPQILSYYDVPAFYLPQKPLEALSDEANPLKAPDVDAALWRRWAAWFLPGAYALLGASLAPIAGSGRVVSPGRIVVLAMAGYFALVATKVSWAMGEIGALSGFTSSWIGVIFALLGVVVAQAILSRPH